MEIGSIILFFIIIGLICPRLKLFSGLFKQLALIGALTGLWIYLGKRREKKKRDDYVEAEIV